MQLCKEGPNCRRPVCFFAHSVLDLRQPSHMFDPASGGAEVRLTEPWPMLLLLLVTQRAGCNSLPACR